MSKPSVKHEVLIVTLFALKCELCLTLLLLIHLVLGLYTVLLCLL